MALPPMAFWTPYDVPWLNFSILKLATPSSFLQLLSGGPPGVALPLLGDLGCSWSLRLHVNLKLSVPISAPNRNTRLDFDWHCFE